MHIIPNAFFFCYYSMAQSIKIMFAIAIFITYALQAYVPVEIMWKTYLDRRIPSRKLLWEYVCRTAVTLATCEYHWYMYNIISRKLNEVALRLHLRILSFQSCWQSLYPGSGYLSPSSAHSACLPSASPFRRLSRYACGGRRTILVPSKSC